MAKNIKLPPPPIFDDNVATKAKLPPPPIFDTEEQISPSEWAKQRTKQIALDRQEFDAAGNDNTAPIQIAETAGEVGGALKQAVVDPVLESAKLVGRGINETMRPVVGLKRATMMRPGEARTSAIKEIGANVTTDVSRGAADIATGALGVGINMMPAMAGVNLASSVARPLITDAVKKIGGSDSQVEVANKIFDYALAAKAFGYPVVRGMAAGELFGKLADMGVNTEADWNNLNTEDKDRIINLAHNVGFFAGAGTEPTRVERNVARIGKRAGNYAVAKAEDALSYIKPIRAEDAGYTMPSGNTSEGRSSTLEILGNELPAKGGTSVPRASVINPIIATPGGQADISKTFVSAERLDASKAAVDLPNVENRLTYIDQKIDLLKVQSKDARGADREAIAKEISDLHAEKQVLSIQADNYRGIIAEVGQNIAPRRGGLLLAERNAVRPLAQEDLAGVNRPDPARQNYSIVPPEQLGENRPASSILRPEQGPGVSRNQAVPEQKVFYPDNRINVNELAKVLREAEASNTLNYAISELMYEVDRRGLQIPFAQAMEEAGAMNSYGQPPKPAEPRPAGELPPSTPPRSPEPIVFNVDEGRAKVIQDKLDRGMQLNAREIAERQKFEEAGVKFTEKPKEESISKPESAKPVEPGSEIPAVQKNRTPAESEQIVPKFKNTQEALAFGKRATPEQLAELTRLREDALARAKALQDRYAAGEKKVAQEMINVGTEAQLYREALEANGKKIEEKKPEKPVKPVKAEKPVSKKSEVPVKKGRIGRPKKYAQADENTYPIINSGFKIRPDWKLRDGKVSIVEEFEPIKDFLDLSDKPSKERLMAAENGIIRGNIDQIASEYAGEVGNPRYEDAENFRGDLVQEIDSYNSGGGFLNKEEINDRVERLVALEKDLAAFENEVAQMNPSVREMVLARVQEIWKEKLNAEQLERYENDPEAKRLAEIEDKVLSATEAGEVEEYLRLLDEVEGAGRPAGEPGARIESEVPPPERDRSGNMFSLLGGGLFLTNQLNTDDETKKKLDFVFGAMLMGGLGMALGSMKAKSIKSVADISEEAMKLYREGKMKAEDIGPFMRSKMGTALDQADAKAGARVAREIEDAIRKENDPKQGVRDAIQAGIKENLLSKELRPDMQKMLRAVSEAHQKADIPGQNRLMFMDKIGGMRRQYGPAGTELQIQVLNGDIVRRDILGFGNERLNVVKEVYKDLDVDQRDEINKSVVGALEDRANADKYLDTAEKQKVYKNVLSIFEYYKGLLREKGYKVIEEDYYTHIGKHDVIDQILQGEDLKDLNKPLDQFISEKSPYLKPRFDVEMEILKDLPKVMTSYMRSVSKEIAYKDAVEYYRGDFRKDIPVTMQGRSMDLAFHNLKNSLNPQFSQGKLMHFADQIRSNQYTGYLAYGLKQSAQNFTQRMLAEMYITPRAKEIYNEVYSPKRDYSGSKIAEIMAQSDKITPKQRKDLMMVTDDLGLETVSPLTKKFRENDFFQKAELGNWHASAAMGIMNVVANDPRFESTLKKNDGDAYKTVNELLEDKELAQKALREADVISMKTQVSPLPGSRMPANDYPLVRLFTSMKNFKLRYIQVLTDIAKPMDGIGGFRAMKIIERGMNGEVIPVEVLRVVENTRKAVEQEVKRVKEKGGKFKMEDGEEIPMQLAQDYLSFLKSKEKELNEVIGKAEPAKRSDMLKTLAKYHAALFSISLVANILGNAADYAAYNISGGAIGSQPDAEDVLNYATLNAVMDQSPMPFYRFDYPALFRPIIFPSIGNSLASAMYNKGIPTKRALARDLVPYAMNIVPFGGLIDRVTGRNISRGIVNTIAPATPKKQSTSLQMIGGPGMPGMPK